MNANANSSTHPLTRAERAKIFAARLTMRRVVAEGAAAAKVDVAKVARLQDAITQSAETLKVHRAEAVRQARDVARVIDLNESDSDDDVTVLAATSWSDVQCLGSVKAVAGAAAVLAAMKTDGDEHEVALTPYGTSPVSSAISAQPVDVVEVVPVVQPAVVAESPAAAPAPIAEEVVMEDAGSATPVSPAQRAEETRCGFCISESGCAWCAGSSSPPASPAAQFSPIQPEPEAVEPLQPQPRVMSCQEVIDAGIQIMEDVLAARRIGIIATVLISGDFVSDLLGDLLSEVRSRCHAIESLKALNPRHCIDISRMFDDIVVRRIEDEFKSAHSAAPSDEVRACVELKLYAMTACYEIVEEKLLACRESNFAAIRLNKNYRTSGLLKDVKDELKRHYSVVRRFLDDTLSRIVERKVHDRVVDELSWIALMISNPTLWAYGPRRLVAPCRPATYAAPLRPDNGVPATPTAETVACESAQPHTPYNSPADDSQLGSWSPCPNGGIRFFPKCHSAADLPQISVQLEERPPVCSPLPAFTSAAAAAVELESSMRSHRAEIFSPKPVRGIKRRNDDEEPQQQPLEVQEQREPKRARRQINFGFAPVVNSLVFNFDVPTKEVRLAPVEESTKALSEVDSTKRAERADENELLSRPEMARPADEDPLDMYTMRLYANDEEADDQPQLPAQQPETFEARSPELIAEVFSPDVLSPKAVHEPEQVADALSPARSPEEMIERVLSELDAIDDAMEQCAESAVPLTPEPRAINAPEVEPVAAARAAAAAAASLPPWIMTGALVQLKENGDIRVVLNADASAFTVLVAKAQCVHFVMDPCQPVHTETLPIHDVFPVLPSSSSYYEVHRSLVVVNNPAHRAHGVVGIFQRVSGTSCEVQSMCCKRTYRDIEYKNLVAADLSNYYLGCFPNKVGETARVLPCCNKVAWVALYALHVGNGRD